MSEHTPTPFSYVAKLTASENHKGFTLYGNNGYAIGDIYPLDEDGIEGALNAQFIVTACNNFEALVEALEFAFAWVPKPEPRDIGPFVDAYVQARAALAAAKETP